MIRFLFTCMFYTTIARWGYAELTILLPQAVPFVNETLAKIQIPTHDTWSREKIHEYAYTAETTVEKVTVAVKGFQDFIEDRKS